MAPRIRGGIVAVIVLTLACLTLLPAAAAPGARRATSLMAVAPAQPVSSNTFRQINPCRLTDTRAATQAALRGPFTSGKVRTYAAVGTLSAQGGTAAGCGVPAGAVSVSVVMTAVTPTGSGYLRAWTAGAAEPKATLLNYPKGNAASVGVPISLSAAGKFTVKNYGGPTQVVIDVLGFFEKPLSGFVAADGTVPVGTSQIQGAVLLENSLIYMVTFSRNIRNCSLQATAYHTGLFISGTTYVDGAPNTAQVHIWSEGERQNVAEPFFITVIC
jgi:hypothetical protein